MKSQGKEKWRIANCSYMNIIKTRRKPMKTIAHIPTMLALIFTALPSAVPSMG
jgi:hypothetical protein